MNDHRNNMTMSDAPVGGERRDAAHLSTYLTSRLPGFTLVELLVVIALVAIAMGISLPTMSAMTRNSDRNTAENAVIMAGNIARAYATRPINDVADADNSTTLGVAATEPGSYSGCIALFTPAGEVRIAENGTVGQRAAVASSDSIPSFVSGDPITALERMYWRAPSGPGSVEALDYGDPQEAKHLNGFTDINIDYINLPADAGVAGIIRDSGGSNNDPPRLLAPPFAIWFDANGTLVATSNFAACDFVYYNGDYLNGFDIGGTGAGSPRDKAPFNPYNPDFFDPRSQAFVLSSVTYYVPTSTPGATGRYVLPFERIEAVTAVMVYSKSKFYEQAKRDGFYWSDGDSTAVATLRWEWMKKNARMVMFTHYGAPMRGLLDN